MLLLLLPLAELLLADTPGASNPQSSNSTDELRFSNDTLLNQEHFDGFGMNFHWLITSECIRGYSELLNHTTEYDKLGSAAATTIMTLLPTMLVFSPLRIAGIRMLLHIDPCTAFGASVFTFGLPVQESTSLDENNSHTVKGLLGPHYSAVRGLFSSEVNSTPV